MEIVLTIISCYLAAGIFTFVVGWWHEHVSWIEGFYAALFDLIICLVAWPLIIWRLADTY